ncbi:MAG: hypothetical protein QHJ34_03960 [bacterium]|jgi:hypothetical protein|nr:hypothetical protein [candidate division KSB1 bacterium]MDH7559371.1 hypothetical protein [bacterium]
MADPRGFVDLVSFLAGQRREGRPLARPKLVIRAPLVRLEREPVQIGERAQPAGGEPKVRAYTRNNVVERIEITCACGRSIEVVLDYTNGANNRGDRP